jgi:hypothetical protein
MGLRFRVGSLAVPGLRRPGADGQCFLPIFAERRRTSGAALGGGADGEDNRNRFGQFALNARADRMSRYS